MILYPAIDIRGGRCVRLVEGDFDRETSYDSDPSLAARRWVEAGAEWLVAGHAIFGGGDAEQAARALKDKAAAAVAR